jgi:DNA-3-methyladenine glycosylase
MGGMLDSSFYARPVVAVARELIGCVLEHGQTSGVIVETEAYHHSEPACHAYAGLTARTRTLFGLPARAYVYRSYGIHALFNAVCEPEGIGAAVLIRALEPVAGIDLMQQRRGLTREVDLCSGPGKLTQALGIELDHNDGSLVKGEVQINPPLPSWPEMEVVVDRRIGITKAVDLPWRFCVRGNPHVSRPRPRSADHTRGMLVS